MLKKSAIDFIMETVKDKSVIVFGIDDLEGREAELSLNVEYHRI